MKKKTTKKKKLFKIVNTLKLFLVKKNYYKISRYLSNKTTFVNLDKYVRDHHLGIVCRHILQIYFHDPNPFQVNIEVEI